ncbi:uncharacterized protein RHO25_006339 [Cercospora beticola]|uniref:Uncharacterized protein n=1 Tax=Cercospora beticola TaxID=122368 RepID=A0ABZ0NQ75_CERBT|nr:hypothetical protein RHO25_006339 [Cercospora beticola]
MKLLMERGARFSREDRISLPLDAVQSLLFGAEKPFLKTLIKFHAHIRSVDPDSYVLKRFAEHGVHLLPTTQDINWDPDFEVSWQAPDGMPDAILAHAVGSLWRWVLEQSGETKEEHKQAFRQQLAYLDATTGHQLVAAATPLPFSGDDGLVVGLDDDVLCESALEAGAEVATWPPDPVENMRSAPS